MVGRATAAESDPPVPRALRVDQQVAPSLSVSPPDHPTFVHTESGSGSVAIINEYKGSSVRCSPCKVVVYASVARTTCRARTVPVR